MAGPVLGPVSNSDEAGMMSEVGRCFETDSAAWTRDRALTVGGASSDRRTGVGWWMTVAGEVGRVDAVWAAVGCEVRLAMEAFRAPSRWALRN